MKTMPCAVMVIASCAAACGCSPDPTDSTELTARPEPEPMLRAEISRVEVEAEAETIRIPIATPERRREFVENAWRFDEDALEIECWVVSAERPEYYTVRRVPALGPFGYELQDEFTVELSDVVHDDRLSGVADMVASSPELGAFDVGSPSRRFSQSGIGTIGVLRRITVVPSGDPPVPVFGQRLINSVHDEDRRPDATLRGSFPSVASRARANVADRRDIVAQVLQIEDALHEHLTLP